MINHSNAAENLRYLRKPAACHRKIHLSEQGFRVRQLPLLGAGLIIYIVSVSAAYRLALQC